jgi:hypothetical protein
MGDQPRFTATITLPITRRNILLFHGIDAGLADLFIIRGQ